MSEVEKMYENAKIEKCNSRLKEIMPDICLKNNKDENYKCEDCEYNWYPEFTAEKQIAILQLLTQRCDLTISHFGEWEFIHYDGREPLEITGKDFTETFAKLISAYWQDLTEEERKQIRSILNG